MFMPFPTTVTGRQLGRHVGLLALAAVTLVGLAACGSDDTSSNDTSSTPIDAAQPAPTAPTEPTDPAPTDPAPPDPSTDSTLGPTAQGQVDLAVQDLTERFDLAESDITVVTVEEVTWRDASLGCPQKGMQYQQVLTPGTRIVLTDGERSFNYHAGAGRHPFYCARPDTPAPD